MEITSSKNIIFVYHVLLLSRHWKGIQKSIIYHLVDTTQQIKRFVRLTDPFLL